MGKERPKIAEFALSFLDFLPAALGIPLSADTGRDWLQPAVVTDKMKFQPLLLSRVCVSPSAPQMHYIPPPDYRGYSQPATYHPMTFEAPENIIPPPDYARYEPKIDYEPPVVKESGRPRLPQKTEKLPPIVEEQTRYVEVQQPIQNGSRPRLPDSRNGYSQPLIVTEDQRTKPLIVDTSSPVPVERTAGRETTILVPREKNFEQPSPFFVHSYLEDRDKLQDPNVNESTRSHIRSIGVPVLPVGPMGLGGKITDYSGGLSPAQNKAFIRHLENHRKFDTMKSLKSCKDCPLCQMMLGAGLQDEMEEKSRPRRPDIRELFNEAEIDWTLTRRGYNEQAEGEMSVGFRDRVQIIQRDKTHALCRRTDGKMGWLPLYILP